VNNGNEEMQRKKKKKEKRRGRATETRGLFWKKITIISLSFGKRQRRNRGEQ